MKCDELEARTIYVDCLGRTIIYFDPYEVNEAIKELKARIAQLEDDNALLRKNNAELREATRWRKYPEEKPEDGQVVWAYETNSKRVLTLEYKKNDEGEGFICFPYTHDFYKSIIQWMPQNKPKAPEVK